MNESGVLRAVHEQFAVDRQWRSYPQSLSGAVVDFISNRIELLLAVDAQIRPLGQVLAHQAIHVLVGTPLPGAVRVAEVHRYAGLLAELLVHAHLPALVVRHAQAHRLGNAQQLVREALQDVGKRPATPS